MDLKLSDPKWAGVRLVSWDVDGTLYSSRALQRAWLRHHFPWRVRSAFLASRRFHREVERQRSGDAVVQSQRLAAHADAAAAEELLLPRLLESVGPRADAVELLEALARAGIAQVALSDFPANEKLKALQLSRFFTAVYCASALGHWKPSGELLTHVARAHGVSVDAVLHIGDRPETDGEAARRAGCRFLAF